MAWKPEKVLHRSPFKKSNNGQGEGEWTFLDDRGGGLPNSVARQPQQQQIPPPFPQPSSSSSGLDIPMSRLSFKSQSPSSSFGSGVGRAYSVDADSSFSRHYRQSLDQAEQQTAYWQARAKEAEQSILQYKTECVSLQCQLNTLQCSYRSLDEMVTSFHSRLQSIGALLSTRSNQDLEQIALQADEKLAAAEGQVVLDPIRQRSKKLADIESTLTMLQESLSSAQSGLSPDKESVIAFRSFKLGDVALFFPTPHGDFLAFNVGCPHRYLSKESKAMIGSDRHFRKYYVLGRISRATRCQVPTAEESSRRQEGGANNREGGEEGEGQKGGIIQALAAGTVYWVLHVEPIAESNKEAVSSSSTSTAAFSSSSLSVGAVAAPARLE